MVALGRRAGQHGAGARYLPRCLRRRGPRGAAVKAAGSMTIRENSMYRTRILCAFLPWVLAACGGGGGGSSAPHAVPFTGDITGRLVAPNGVTPIAGATVYIDSPGASVRALPRGTANGDCPAPQTAGTWTCSTATGEFSFAVTDLPPGSTLHASKGVWALALPLRFTAQSTGSLGAVAFGTDVAAGAARIAVVTGAYDHIAYLLARMGLGDVLDE